MTTNLNIYMYLWVCGFGHKTAMFTKQSNEKHESYSMRWGGVEQVQRRASSIVISVRKQRTRKWFWHSASRKHEQEAKCHFVSVDTDWISSLPPPSPVSVMVAKSLLILLPSQLAKHAKAQTQTSAGENVSGESWTVLVDFFWNKGRMNELKHVS